MRIIKRLLGIPCATIHSDSPASKNKLDRYDKIWLTLMVGLPAILLFGIVEQAHIMRHGAVVHKVPPAQDGTVAFGSPAAPNLIKVFSSVSCSHCRAWWTDNYQEMQTLLGSGQYRFEVTIAPHSDDDQAVVTTLTCLELAGRNTQAQSQILSSFNLEKRRAPIECQLDAKSSETAIRNDSKMLNEFLIGELPTFYVNNRKFIGERSLASMLPKPKSPPALQAQQHTQNPVQKSDL